MSRITLGYIIVVSESRSYHLTSIKPDELIFLQNDGLKKKFKNHYYYKCLCVFIAGSVSTYLNEYFFK